MIVYYILDIHKSDDIELLGELAGVLDDYSLDAVGEVLCGIYRNRVARVDARTLDMLHNARDKEVLAVADSVDLDLRSHHVLVDEDGIFDVVAHDNAHVLLDVGVGVSDYHILSAEYI